MGDKVIASGTGNHYCVSLLRLDNGRESMQRMINSHVEASKIGREIAERVLEYHRRCGDHSSGNYSLMIKSLL